MKYYFLSLIAAAALIVSGCGSVPVTGRKQLLLVSDKEVLTLSLQQYDEFIKTASLSTDKKNSDMVKRVGQSIANAVEAYLKSNGMEGEVSNFAWEFNLVKSNDVNAFCMPGGKIVVYEGILPYTQTETGLAVVIGHEVAHAVAKHSNERMSQQMAAQYGTSAIGGILNNKSEATKQIVGTALGLGSQYGVILPYSRKQELEADKLGMIFMAMGGYNPNDALSFWTRMSEKSGGGTPEFMSTHPSDQTRIQSIKDCLPEVMKYYKGGGSGSSNSSGQWKF